MRIVTALLGLGAAYALWRTLSSSPSSAAPSTPAPAPQPRDDGEGGALIDQGTASWYPPTGRPTANGDAYDGTELTAAHRTLPFNTVVEVVDNESGNAVVVRINDRGPASSTGRVIDLSPAAADKLGFRSRGLTSVSIFTV